MTRIIPSLYSVTEREYRNITNLFKGLAIVGVATTAIGLAGIVANQVISPESLETIRNFASNGLPITISGGIMMLYGGINYFGNRSLNKTV